MTPEQIEGYLRRLEVRYSHDDEPGPDGVFHVRFRTVSYRSKLPPRDKQLQLLVRLSNNGELLTLSAPYVYLLGDAKHRGAFCEYLLDLNFRIKVAQFQVDRRDGEVACVASVPVEKSNLSFEAFQRLLYVIPFVVDFHHEETRAVMKKGKLPPVPKVPQIDLMIADVLQRVGSVAKLREIVDAHERRATSTHDGTDQSAKPDTAAKPRKPKKGPKGLPLNPLPPADDFRGGLTSGGQSPE